MAALRFDGRPGRHSPVVCTRTVFWKLQLVLRLLIWVNGMKLTTPVSRPVPATDIDPALLLQSHIDKCDGTRRLCEIGSTKFGRGLVAIQDIEPHEVVLKIPLSECIVIEDASNYVGQNSGGEDLWASRLAVELMERFLESDQNACPYARALPTPPPTPVGEDWSREALLILDDEQFLEEIRVARTWREEQWKSALSLQSQDGGLAKNGTRELFLDALDLVSSRTIRCGNKFMLVPYMDLANHASRDEGGGFYQLLECDEGREQIVLKAGDRGIPKGNEVFLDYGKRRNEEWLLFYGFLPDRNTLGASVSVRLANGSVRSIGWGDVGKLDPVAILACQEAIERSETSLSDDILHLKEVEAQSGDPALELAWRYRVAQKMLLNAAAGTRSSSAFQSIFAE